MDIQIWIFLCSLAAFAIMGFAMSRSIKKYDKAKATAKKKKGRLKYMPEVKSKHFK